MQLSRRSFLLGLGTLTSLVAGCGGGGSETSGADPGHFTANQNGSVIDNTRSLFEVTTRYDPDTADYKVVALQRGNQTLLAGEWLVFEVNGQWRVSGGDSAVRTHVRRGDIIGWKVVS